MSESIGIDCALSLGGVAVPAIIQGCSPDFNKALQPILVANGGNPLIGYSPGNGAKSGFNVQFFLPYDTGAAALNAALATAGLAIALSFDTAGGVSLAGAKCVDLTVSGSENNKIEARASFESASKPVYGAQVIVPGDFSIGVWLFNDVTGFTLLAGTHLDVSQFQFRVTHAPVRFVGNSVTGIPKKFRLGHPECMFDLEYLKEDDTEGAAAITDCQTIGDVTIALAQACNGSHAMSLVANDATYGIAPTNNGQLEAFDLERITGMATLGAYHIN